MDALIEKAMRTPYNLSHGEIVSLLSLEDTDELFSAAYQLKCRYIGKTVSMRGIIEMGNVCAKDCYYCGIRRGNSNVKRYQLSEDDVVRMARWGFRAELRFAGAPVRRARIRTAHGVHRTHPEAHPRVRRR